MKIIYSLLLLLTLPTILMAMNSDDKSPRGVLLEDITWLEAEKLLTEQAVVVIPLGAGAKEHGPHLKLKNDLILAEYLKKRVQLQSNVVIAPTVNYHFFPAFLEYPGSTSLRLETARDLIIDICRSLAKFGPRRFYVLNTGVSTRRPLRLAAEILAAEGIVMRFTDIGKVAEAVEKEVKKQQGGTHADEIETSMMLYMDPASVDMSKAVKDYHPDKGPLTRNANNNEGTYSATGIWGDPTLATREKGEKIVEAMVSGIVKDIEDLRTSTQVAIKTRLASLVAAEKAFAKSATVKPTRDAFLDVLAEDSIVYRAGAGVINGRKFYSEQPVGPALLTWQPAYADISEAGDIGYTTGPWELRRNGAKDNPAVYGNYVSIWKQVNGVWRLLIDLGTVNPPPNSLPAGVSSPITSNPIKAAALDSEKAALLKADRELGTALTDNGFKGYQNYLADDGRIHRDNFAPFVGKEAVQRWLAEQTGSFSSQPLNGEVAASADLGYTYGNFEMRAADASDKPAVTGFYVRIWKKQSDGTWRIVLDIINR